MEELTISQQAKCISCNSFKLQLIYITATKKLSDLHLICRTCGLLQTIKLGSGVKIPQPKEIGDKSKPGYL